MILMSESQLAVFSFDLVSKGLGILGQYPLVTALLTLCFRQRSVLIAPTLIAEGDLISFLGVERHKDGW